MSQQNTTHEFAYQLRRFAAQLLNGPDIPLSQLQLSDPNSLFQEVDSRTSLKKGKKQTSARVDLIKVIADLSTVKKSEWLEIVRRAEIPMNIRPRDAARDILNRLFVYIKDNPDARERLRSAVSDEHSAGQPNSLSDALRTLLEVS